MARDLGKETVMFFDQAHCRRAGLAYCALLTYALTHSWVMEMVHATDGIHADPNRDTRIQTLWRTKEWWRSRPKSLFGLFLKYSLWLILVLFQLAFLLAGSLVKIALWTACAILVFPSCSLAAVRLRTY